MLIKKKERKRQECWKGLVKERETKVLGSGNQVEELECGRYHVILRSHVFFWSSCFPPHLAPNDTVLKVETSLHAP